MGSLRTWLSAAAAVAAAAATSRYLPATAVWKLTRTTRGSRERQFGGNFRTGIHRMYISVGDRVRPPSKGYYAPSDLGEARVVGVVVFGPLLWVDSIPGGMYICTRFQVSV